MPYPSELTAAWEQFTGQGSAEAFEKVYQKTSDALFSYGHCFTGHESLVDDAVQEVFIDIWNRRDQLTHVKKIKPYLFQALRNKILTKVARQRRSNDLQPESTLLASIPSIEKELISEEEKTGRLQLLEKAIQHLPKRQKEILFLKFFEGYRYTEIAAMLSIQPQVARNLASRAIKKIRIHLMENAEKFWMILFLPSFLLFF